MIQLRHLLLAFLALFATQAALADEELLEPDQAFRLEVSPIDGNTVRARWVIADGYYLYRNKIKFKSDTAGVTLGEPRLPKGKVKKDEFFGDVEIYRGTIDVELPIERPAGTGAITITATSQGCADAGVCYPPHKQSREVTLPEVKPLVQPLPGFGTPATIQPFGSAQDELLEADQAFQASAIALDGQTLRVDWVIAPGYYLYRDKLKFELLDSDGVTLGSPEIPQGEEKEDEFFGRIQVFHNAIEVRLPLIRSAATPTAITLQLGYQGCAEAGVCYPPIKKRIAVDLPAAGTAAVEGVPASSAPQSEQDSLAASLKSGNTLTTLLLFFGLGLLLASTPCVFPMIPILSSIIVGHGDQITTRKAFTLSLVYVLAMALTYTVAGVIAGLFGANLQAAFQNPWVLGTFSALFVLLALSMFGFYELQLPSALQTKLSEISNKQQGGSLLGVAIMGLLSALIVGPCVAPPLMGALVYIGQTGDAVLGGLALFFLSLGMGAPLLAIGTSAGKLLPRAGGWMNAVKAVFGVLLLAVAIWMLERILPGAVTMVLWGLLLVISAIYMGGLDTLDAAANGWRRLWKGLGLVLLVWGVLLLIGAASGGSDPLQPLRFGSAGAVASTATPGEPAFKRVASTAELDAAIAAATSQGKPVMIDFYADWCVSCKEFEKYTFSDPAVQAALADAVLLQVDVTENSDEDQALLKRYRLFGPPAILFFDRHGLERSAFHLVGFVPAPEFARHAREALAR
ncbi:MAG TPA: protein-disulfide reductase DsbD [Gammaproteobacteria bacterium]